MKRYVFDLDNTLIYTNLLNSDAYNYALNLQGLGPINDCKRITRDIVFKKYPNLNNVQKNKIIKLKQEYFVNNLERTIPNKELLQVLKTHNVEYCILWTSADEIRVKAILDYYDISNAFRKILFSNKIEVIQDIKKICELFECCSEQLIFYEDNPRVIKELQQLNLHVIPCNPWTVSSVFLKSLPRPV